MGIRYCLAQTPPSTLPTVNRTTKIKTSNHFTAAYLRVLGSQEPRPEDYWAAKDLIEHGHATGQMQISRDRNSFGQVTHLLAFAPTLSGRLFADELAEAARRRTWRFRLVQACGGVVTFALGWLAGVASEVSKAALLGALGLSA